MGVREEDIPETPGEKKAKEEKRRKILMDIGDRKGTWEKRLQKEYARYGLNITLDDIKSGDVVELVDELVDIVIT